MKRFLVFALVLALLPMASSASADSWIGDVSAELGDGWVILGNGPDLVGDGGVFQQTGIWGGPEGQRVTATVSLITSDRRTDSASSWESMNVLFESRLRAPGDEYSGDALELASKVLYGCLDLRIASMDLTAPYGSTFLVTKFVALCSISDTTAVLIEQELPRHATAEIPTQVVRTIRALGAE